MRSERLRTREPLDVIVIGAGIAGLSAAWELRDTNLLVLEAEPRVGGRLLSEPREPYWLNFGGHVLSGPDSATGQLARSVGVELNEVPGVLTALALDASVISSSRVETYPLRLPLSMTERIALARAGLKVRIAVARYARTAAHRPAESEASRRACILSFRDDQTFADFLGPLPPRVDAIFRATIRRSSGEPEHVSAGYGIGYFQLVWDRNAGLTRNVVGGSSLLPEKISATLGDRIATSCEVKEVESDAAGVTVRFRELGEIREARARYAVAATPADVTREIVRGLPTETERALQAIRYGPYVVGAILTKEVQAMPYDHIYALATPGRSFNMLFNTANLLRSGPRAPGGSLMVYSGADLARQLDDADDAAVARRYVEDLSAIFPATHGSIEEVRIKRWPRGLPHPEPGRHAVQLALERELGRIYLAGDYLGTTYVETAVQSGTLAAHSVRAMMGVGDTRNPRGTR